jgi:hypothetical protein
MPNKNKDNIKFDLKRYETDVAGVSVNKLEAELWWMKNRPFLKKILIIFLLFFIFITWVYSLYNIGDYLLNGMRQDEKMLRELVNTEVGSQELLVALAAKDISISSVGALKNSFGYDFYAIIKNPNDKHRAIFSYCFMSGEEKIICGEDFLLPAQKKYILSLGVKDVSLSSGLKFVNKNTVWKRINQKEIPDWKSYSQERSNIEIKNISTAIEDGGDFVSFSVKNETPFGFWEVPLAIIIEQGGKITNVNRYLLSQFVSFEERQIKINWPDGTDVSGKVSIYPDLNILDKNIYMEPAR